MLLFMLAILGFYALLLAASSALIMGPTLLLKRLGFAKSSLAAGTITTGALTADYFYNWDAIEYPHWLLGAPAQLFILTFPVGISAIWLGVLAVIEQMAGDGMVAPEPLPRLPGASD